MQNLELMKDFEFNIESENNDTPQSKYNFFKNRIALIYSKFLISFPVI